jgi:MinD superfamily P-loop ATPase
MKIAVASGKGGTGKTTLAVNLALAAGGPVRLVDCDVEEPNAHIFLAGKPKRRLTVSVPVPQIDKKRCVACGVCAAFCRFNALVSFGVAPVVFPELCHGCGGCVRVCPKNAIREIDRRIGTVETSEVGAITLIQGRLDVGAASALPVIRAAKREAGDGLVIVDAPPGTSCPMVAALKDADYVLLVTEPTPFGRHDLALAVETVRGLGLPFGVVVNRAVPDAQGVRDYCRASGIALLAEIPDDRRIAELYARGETIVGTLPEYRETFACLLREVLSKDEAA